VIEYIAIEYIAYTIIIALAVRFSYNAGAKEGMEFGVNYCLDNLEDLGIINVEIDKEGNEIVTAKHSDSAQG